MSGGEDLLVSYYSAILAKACSVGDDFAQLYDIIVERCSKDQADHALEKARQLSVLNPKTLAIKIRWLESKIPKSLRISCDMNLPPSPQSDNIVKDESSAISSKPKGYVVVNVGNSVDDGIGFSLSNVSLDKNIDARKKLNDPIEEKFENENSIELGSMRKKSSKTRENITTDDSKSSKNKTNCDGSSVKSNRNQRRKKLKADQKNKDIVSTASAEVPPARNNKPSKKQNKESKKEETKQMLTSPSTSSPTVKSLELGDQLEEKKTTPNADILTDEVVQQILQKCDPLSDKKQKPVPKEKSQKKKKKKTKKTTSDERKQQEN
uniref:Uncharacterized protein n=1 Tax=Ciona savignyi TaxID=51511 RepID=H2YMY3_CIOSA